MDVKGRREPGYVAPDLQLVGAEHVRRYLETGGRVRPLADLGWQYAEKAMRNA